MVKSRSQLCFHIPAFMGPQDLLSSFLEQNSNNA